MNWKEQYKPLLIILLVFFIIYFLPISSDRFDNALFESLYMVKWYAREHTVLCLLPAFLIAGAIGVFISQQSVMKYLGAGANKILAYAVGSVSGAILAVCSCTVLPLFAGIYKRGAGLGPAIAFLYSGPAINILAIILTARILGFELGIARALGAIIFSIVIGLIMAFIFRKEEKEKFDKQANMIFPDDDGFTLKQNIIYFALMIGILIFANWGRPSNDYGFFSTIYSVKWIITSILAIVLGLIMFLWFKIKLWKMILVGLFSLVSYLILPNYPIFTFAVGLIGLSIVISNEHNKAGEWFWSSWGFTKQIFPMLFFGVVVSGFLLGRPGNEGIIPSSWVSSAVGGNSLIANFFASIVGAFMYFATITEIPIVQGLIGSGMGKGPALALLLSGPALSLPSMLVLHSIMGMKKTVIYICLVIIMSTITGLIFGAIFQ